MYNIITNPFNFICYDDIIQISLLLLIISMSIKVYQINIEKNNKTLDFLIDLFIRRNIYTEIKLNKTDLTIIKYVIHNHFYIIQKIANKKYNLNILEIRELTIEQVLEITPIIKDVCKSYKFTIEIFKNY